MSQIHELFKIMKKAGASDLVVSTGSPPTMKLYGSMVPMEGVPELTAEQAQTLIFSILTDRQKKEFTANWELDCSYSLEGVARFRTNVFMHRKGMGAIFRIIPQVIPTFEELHFPESVEQLIDCEKGIILLTGPTGCGKSTTMASIINFINENEKGHILCIEDPIEFLHPNKESIVRQRGVSSHTKSFSAALKSSLRQDPDIILVGEMRDLETMSLAITAAETGHLVFGTLHTSSAAKTVDRIIDIFPPEKQPQIRAMLAESLRGVISQNLIRKKDGVGMVAAMEILVNTRAIKNLIREGKTYQIQSMIETGSGQGMQTFETAVTNLIEMGMVKKEDVQHYLSKNNLHKIDKDKAKEGASKDKIVVNDDAAESMAGGIKIFDENDKTEGEESSVKEASASQSPSGEDATSQSEDSSPPKGLASSFTGGPKNSSANEEKPASAANAQQNSGIKITSDSGAANSTGLKEGSIGVKKGPAVPRPNPATQIRTMSSNKGGGLDKAKSLMGKFGFGKKKAG